MSATCDNTAEDVNTTVPETQENISEKVLANTKVLASQEVSSNTKVLDTQDALSTHCVDRVNQVVKAKDPEGRTSSSSRPLLDALDQASSAPWGGGRVLQQAPPAWGPQTFSEHTRTTDGV